ncbi:MAG: outer membrane beta-barrel protein [Glaciecola sp.]|jgi:outer membrane beta-barrel protein
MKFNNKLIINNRLIISAAFVLSVCLFQGQAFAQTAPRMMQANDEKAPALIDPNIKRRDISESDIDTEDFEIGIFGGFIGIEDFESSELIGASISYHINENLFLEARYAQATAGQTSFEKLSGGAPFLTEEERDYTYYNLSLGYNINGETFFTDNLVFNSDFYFTVGAGSTEFGGDERFTVSVGAGYRLLLTDWWALKVDVRDHVFTSDIIGVEKDVHNLALTLGTTFFF